MTTNFGEFVFDNQTGIDTSVTLEAPIGSKGNSYQVPSATKSTFTPNLGDIKSVTITVFDGTHTTKQSIDLTTSGNPYGTLIESVEAQYQIGAVHGTVKVRY